MGQYLKKPIWNRVKSKIVEIETTEIKECLYTVFFSESLVPCSEQCIQKIGKKGTHHHNIEDRLSLLKNISGDWRPFILHTSINGVK